MINSFRELQRALKKDVHNMPSIKVALVGDSATQMLATAIKGSAIIKGYNIEMLETDYNQVERQFMDKSSDLHLYEADFIVVFQSTHKLLSEYNKLSAEAQSSLSDNRLDFVRAMSTSTNTKIIYLNYPEIDDTVFGSYSNKTRNSFTYQVRSLNYELMNLSQEYANLYICDIAAVQNKIGRDKMFHTSIYASTDMVISIDALPYVANRVTDIIMAIKGSFKKCLILDLDNTLWGGVIGDDGIERIHIGHGLGIGKVYKEIQEWALKLKKRGIILAICSKNNEDVAKEPFINHPEMILRLDDIAVFVANWENKADNIRKIQSILNIGFDSMVFLDDNPFERNLVRENLPDVTVPELPDDAAQYLEYLYSLNLFETASYSNADSDRTLQYQVEAKRAVAQFSFTNEGDFLKSLDMTSEVRGFNSFNTPRVSQLSQRSNQFNLRTIRYTESDIEQLALNDSYHNLSFTLIDKYGDNGLICVIILNKQDSDTLYIDTWLMSCRVLRRGMEHFTLNEIIKYAQQNGFTKIIGEYIPTAKNQLVQNHYSDLGFENISDNGQHMYKLNVDEYVPKETFITAI